MKKMIGLAMIVLALSSCNQYYKATLANIGESSISTIENLKNAGRYFILRNVTQAFAMSNMVVNKGERTVQCTLDSLPPEHQLHLDKGIRGKMIYEKMEGYDTPVLNEVHLYTTGNNTVQSGPYTIPVSQIQKIEVLEKDRQKTTNRHIVGGSVAILATAATVFVIAVAASSSSVF